MFINAGTYTVYFEEADFPALSRFLENSEAESFFVIGDEHTMQHCFPLISHLLPRQKLAGMVTIRAGEHHKTLDTAAGIWQFLANANASRKSLVINLGGGMVTDIGGFSAAVFKRGIPFVHIPTSLLAQVDASVGAKTGIDFAGYKNMIGTFSEPAAVFIHTKFLETLPKRQLLSGFAEALKHALIADAGYWEELKTADFSSFSAMVVQSVKIKNAIVLQDPKESGDRRKLNFGHTIGHAIESFFLGSAAEVLHGEAIAAGMICEAFISREVNGLEENALKEIVTALTRFYELLPLKETDDAALIKYMQNDKKNDARGIGFTLLRNIGTAAAGHSVSEEMIAESFRYYRSL